jgi:transcriptional regulator with XRE-family HTH domain
MQPLRKRLGLAIRRIRSGTDLSQEALAQKSKLHRTTMSEIERGISNVSIDVAERIAKALGVKLSQLFAEAEKDR